MAYFRRFGVKELRYSETFSDEKYYPHRSMRRGLGKSAQVRLKAGYI